jgi:hypothetical protein
MNESIGCEIKPIEMGFRQPASAGLEVSHQIHSMELAMEIAPMNEFIGYRIKPIEMGSGNPLQRVWGLAIE